MRRKTFNSMSPLKSNPTNFVPCEKIFRKLLLFTSFTTENSLNLIVGVFCALRNYHVRLKTANRHNGWKIMLSGQVLLSKTNVSKSTSYILLSLTPYFLLNALSVLAPMCLIQPFCFCPCLITDETPTHRPLLCCSTPLASSLHVVPPVQLHYSSPFPSNFLMFFPVLRLNNGCS